MLSDSIVQLNPAAGGPLYWRGVVAIAGEDTAGARSILHRLEQIRSPYGAGAITRNRARLHAALGEKDQAVQLLQRAFSEGASFQLTLAASGFHIGFESLRGFPPYEAFIKPR